VGAGMPVTDSFVLSPFSSSLQEIKKTRVTIIKYFFILNFKSCKVKQALVVLISVLFIGKNNLGNANYT
jgi:hypothetical protein